LFELISAMVKCNKRKSYFYWSNQIY
jgi:hypothetical protein